jgi:mannan endo-1,4-beta-mannosidase
MIRTILASALAALALSACAAEPAAAETGAKRAAVLTYLRDLEASHRTLAGVQVNEYEVYIDCTSYERVAQQVGARPALLGLELMNAIAYPPYPRYLTDRALEQESQGGLVTMSWHHRNPVEVCPRGEYYECAKKTMSAETLHAMLTPGTREHDLWLADVNRIGALLADWKARGLVVLFRPYHEMNGNWFWWGQQDEYPALWDALYEELAVKRGLDNLIWVWSGDRETPNAARYAPRAHAPDVAGIDVYENDVDSPKYAAGRASVMGQAPHAAFAFTEVGKIPSEAVFDAQNPAWVLLWGGEYLNGEWAWNNQCEGCNTAAEVAQFFARPRTLTLDEMPAALRATLSAGVSYRPGLHAAHPSCPARLR